MSVREQQRERVVALVADHLLETGLTQTSLRQLATAAGVSDRMLLYYFPDKSAVLAAGIERVAGNMASRMAEMVPDGTTYPPSALLAKLATLAMHDDLRPVFRVWVEIVAAARREEPYTTLAAKIIDGFRIWVSARLDLREDADRDAMAMAILAFVDGLALVDICCGSGVALKAAGAIEQLVKA